KPIAVGEPLARGLKNGFALLLIKIRIDFVGRPVFNHGQPRLSAFRSPDTPLGGVRFHEDDLDHAPQLSICRSPACAPQLQVLAYRWPPRGLSRPRRGARPPQRGAAQA